MRVDDSLDNVYLPLSTGQPSLDKHRGGLVLAVRVGTGDDPNGRDKHYCLPPHQHNFEPSFLDFNGIL